MKQYKPKYLIDPSDHGELKGHEVMKIIKGIQRANDFPPVIVMSLIILIVGIVLSIFMR